jgi:hypothetical protein
MRLAAFDAASLFLFTAKRGEHMAHKSDMKYNIRQGLIVTYVTIE